MSFSAAGWGRGPAGAAQKPIRAENRSGRARRLDLKRIRRSKGSRGGRTPAIFPRGRSRPHGAPRRSRFRSRPPRNLHQRLRLSGRRLNAANYFYHRDRRAAESVVVVV